MYIYIYMYMYMYIYSLFQFGFWFLWFWGHTHEIGVRTSSVKLRPAVCDYPGSAEDLENRQMWGKGPLDSAGSGWEMWGLAAVWHCRSPECHRWRLLSKSSREREAVHLWRPLFTSSETEATWAGDREGRPCPVPI